MGNGSRAEGAAPPAVISLIAASIRRERDRAGLSLTELAFAPLWVWLALGEVPSASTLLGGAAIIAAIMYQALSGARRRRAPLPMV